MQQSTTTVAYTTKRIEELLVLPQNPDQFVILPLHLNQEYPASLINLELL